MKNRVIKRKKVIYKTPGRECAHADRGCCPKCIDPCRLMPASRLGSKIVKQVRKPKLSKWIRNAAA